MSTQPAGLPCRDPEPRDARRLWSLWDMLRFQAAPFYAVTVEMQRSAGVLHTNGEDEFKNTPEGGLVITTLNDRVIIKLLKERASTLVKCLETLGAPSSKKVAERFLAEVSKGSTSYPVLCDYYRDIDSRLRDELEDVLLFVIEGDKRRYFEPSEPLFGAEVATKFVGLAYEIDEAGKCLALGRPTAATFHLMRIMETAVRTVARCLGIPDPISPADRSWGKVLGSIMNDGIKKKWPTVTDRATGDGALFDALYASLDAAKNPWRNTTMHVDSKYTDDEAEHIFVAVKGLMKRLASRMDEDGKPYA